MFIITATIFIAVIFALAALSENDESINKEILQDINLPVYHFVPMNHMNDIIPIFWNGEYHIFYEHNPDSAEWAAVTWEHISSKDLINWKKYPTAFSREGNHFVFTGCVVEKDGLFHAIYTYSKEGMGPGEYVKAITPDIHPEVQYLSISKDLVSWEPYKNNPILAKPPEGYGTGGWRDPNAWREGDTWYMVLGAAQDDFFKLYYEGIEKDKTLGTALLYESKDLIHWKYLHPLYTGVKGQDYGMFECPDFFKLGDKYVLLYSFYHTNWRVGDYKDHKFAAEKFGVTDGGKFYAAKSMSDNKGRRVLFGWIRENRPSEEYIAAGWSGVISLPRVLSMRPNGELGISPPDELENLRGYHWESRAVKLEPSDKSLIGKFPKDTSVSIFDDIRGNELEIIVRFQPGDAELFGVMLRSTSDLSQVYTIYLDLKKNRMLAGAGLPPMEVTRPLGINGVWEDEPFNTVFKTDNNQEITLRIYLDHSVMELFANDSVCLTGRPYTQNPEATRVGIFSTGGSVNNLSVEAWNLKINK